MRSDAGAKRRRVRTYNQAVKTVEQQLEDLQLQLQEEHQLHEGIVDRNCVLAAMLELQDRLFAVHQKHLLWLSGQQPAAAAAPTAAGQHGSPPAPIPSWIMHSLERASLQQLQQALSHDCPAWMAWFQGYFTRLVQLDELQHRTPETQHSVLALDAAAAQDPAAAAAAAAAAAGGRQFPGVPAAYDSTLPGRPAQPTWREIVRLMQAEGRKALLAVLHSQLALYDAASRLAGTGERQEAPAKHWQTVVQRMRLSRQQVSHIRLAFEEFQRQASAAAADSMARLRQVPDRALLADLPHNAPSAQQNPGPSTNVAGPASPEEPTDSAVQPGGRTAEHPAAAAAPAAAPRRPSAPAAGTGAAPQPAAAAAALQGLAVPSAPAASSGEALAQSVAAYQWWLLCFSVFLLDTLSLEQSLQLSLASFPFWPDLAAVAEAITQQPETTEEPQDTPEVPQRPVRHLMAARMQAMQQWERRYVSLHAGGGAGGPVPPA